MYVLVGFLGDPEDTAAGGAMKLVVVVAGVMDHQRVAHVECEWVGDCKVMHNKAFCVFERKKDAEMI